MKKVIFLSLFLMFINVSSQKIWTLQESIEYAKKNNLQIIANQYNTQIEEYNLQISKNSHLPSVSAGMNNSLRFGQTQGFQGSIGRNDNFSNDINISANLMLYNGGKIKKEIEQKEADVNVAKYNAEATKYNISLQIIEQYLSILLNKEILKVNESTLENAQKLYEKAKITTEIGTTSQSVLAEAEAALSREKQNKKTTEINIKRSLFALAQTLQLSDYQNFDVENIPTEENLQASLYNIDEITEKAYNNQPQIKSAEFRIKSAEAQTKIAKTSFLPTISLNAGIGSFYYNSLVTDITGVDSFGNYIKEKGLWQQYKDNFYQQMGVSVNIPIFNKGITKIQLSQARINEENAKNNLAIQKQELRQNIQKVYFDMESHYEAYLSAQQAEKSTKLALDFAEKSYEAGKTSIYDLNIARNNYANAQGSVIQAKYNYIFSQKTLEFYIQNNMEY